MKEQQFLLKAWYGFSPCRIPASRALRFPFLFLISFLKFAKFGRVGRNYSRFTGGIQDVGKLLPVNVGWCHFFSRTENVLGRKIGCSGQWGWLCSCSCGEELPLLDRRGSGPVRSGSAGCALGHLSRCSNATERREGAAWAGSRAALGPLVVVGRVLFTLGSISLITFSV